MQMFSKILIANRGEIACRIQRTCARLGIKTVAVYSEADKQALHVLTADESACIGPALAKESYLNIEAIVEAAKQCQVEAIHPGYGFLSENSHFALACQREGIVFIGPEPHLIDRMGDKVEARKIAEEADVPVVPGSNTPVDDLNALLLADKVGFPLMIKPAGGGGGIGMRVVNSSKELLTNVDRARALVKTSFGNPKLYFERFVDEASHVEIQVIADKFGNAIHLHERDCSVQRRHQKVIEETPCIKIDESLRGQLTEASLRLVKYLNYTNAGTIEYLVDTNGAFYFLEMNTRLQVEHPVTEMVTGIDLVELQIAIAAGQKLEVSQEDISPRGHAIEARIYAENPVTLTPVPGTVGRIIEPSMPNVRIDSGIDEGTEITPFYDPMIAKLIVWGDNRDLAIDTLKAALKAYIIHGVENNISVIEKVLSNWKFAMGVHHSGFLEELLEDISNDANDKSIAAAIAVAISVLKENEDLIPSRWKTEGRRKLMESRL